MRNAVSNLLDRVVLGNSPTRRLWFARRIPDGYIRSVQRTDFRTTMRWVARRSAFYRRRFAELHIDPAMVRCPADLGDLFTTSEDLLTSPIEDFLCDRPQAGYETTGTLSPRSKKIFFSLGEGRDMGRDGAAGLWSLGVRRDDRMVSALDLSFWNAGAALRAAAQALGCLLIEAGKIPPAEFYERARDYRFNVMVVEPSWIVSLTEIAERQGTWPVKLMLVGGENMSEKSRRFVEEAWGTDLYLTYGQTESFGSAGTECFRKNGYHLQELKFWLLGNISPWMFERLLEGVEGIGHDWQVLVMRPGLRDAIEVRVELREGASQASVERALLVSLRERFPDMARNVAMGLCELRIVAQPRGSLRTGRKLRAVVDLRKALFGAETAVPSAMPA